MNRCGSLNSLDGEDRYTSVVLCNPYQKRSKMCSFSMNKRKHERKKNVITSISQSILFIPKSDGKTPIYQEGN